MGKGILNYDAATINNLLKTLRENKNVFPFDSSPTAGSEKGITSGAVEEALKDVSSKMKGYFLTGENLKSIYATADEGSKAYVGYNYPYAIYLYESAKGGWYDTGQVGGNDTFNAGEFYTKIQVDEKFTELFSEVETSVKNKDVYEDGLYITDKDGNIILRLDVLDTKSIGPYLSDLIGKISIKNILKDVYEDGLYITDENGNIIAQYDNNEWTFLNFNGTGSSQKKDIFKLYLPDEVCIARGLTIEMYNSQVSWCGNIDNYHFFWNGVGKCMKRKWSCENPCQITEVLLSASGKYISDSDTIIISIGEDNIYLNKDSDPDIFGSDITNTYELGKAIVKAVNSKYSDKYELYHSDQIYRKFRIKIKKQESESDIPVVIKSDNFSTETVNIIQHIIKDKTEYELQLSVFDNNNNLVAQKFTKVIFVKNKNISSKLLPVGDSLSCGKYWYNVLLRFCPDMKFVGTRWAYNNGIWEGGTNYRHEGRPGVTPAYYIGNNRYTFDKYGQNGNDGRTQDLNPFWNPNENKIDISYYKTNYNVEYDIIMIFLGTNGIKEDPSAAVSQIKQFVDGIRQNDLSTPIFIVNTLFRGNQNGIGVQTGNDGYSVSATYKLLEDLKVFNLQVALTEELRSYENLHFIPVSVTHDSEYNFGAVETPVNPHAVQTEFMPTEATHPQSQGYEQFADIMYSTFCAYV